MIHGAVFLYSAGYPCNRPFSRYLRRGHIQGIYIGIIHYHKRNLTGTETGGKVYGIGKSLVGIIFRPLLKHKHLLCPVHQRMGVVFGIQLIPLLIQHGQENTVYRHCGGAGAAAQGQVLITAHVHIHIVRFQIRNNGNQIIPCLRHFKTLCFHNIRPVNHHRERKLIRQTVHAAFKLQESPCVCREALKYFFKIGKLCQIICSAAIRKVGGLAVGGLKHHIRSFPGYCSGKHGVASYQVQVNHEIGICESCVNHLLNGIVLTSGICRGPDCEHLLVRIVCSLRVYLEVIGKGSDKGIPCMSHIGKETAVCPGKLVAVSCYHQIIQLKRQAVDVIDPAAQCRKTVIEVSQIFRHIIRPLNQLDHGIHHIQNTGGLVGGLAVLAEHPHNGIQPGILRLQDILHMGHIIGNLIITIRIRIGSSNGCQFTVQLV